MGARLGRHEPIAPADRFLTIQHWKALEEYRTVIHIFVAMLRSGPTTKRSKTMNESLKVTASPPRSGARTRTSGSHPCARSSRMSRARNANTHCVLAPSHSAGATSRLLSSTTIRASQERRQPGGKGFQHLVTDVGMGAVCGDRDGPRVKSHDWQGTMPTAHRLPLEICALADTLILDEDGIYDPANFNDRLLLGLKGTMSEPAELHVLKARLRGGILNKARRGEYHCPLPTGFVYDEAGQCRA